MKQSHCIVLAHCLAYLLPALLFPAPVFWIALAGGCWSSGCFALLLQQLTEED